MVHQFLAIPHLFLLRACVFISPFKNHISLVLLAVHDKKTKLYTSDSFSFSTIILPTLDIGMHNVTDFYYLCKLQNTFLTLRIYQCLYNFLIFMLQNKAHSSTAENIFLRERELVFFYMILLSTCL